MLISFKGSLIIPGFFEEAKKLLLYLLKYLKRGMLPTILTNLSYDLIDTTWWWVKCFKDYLE